MEEDIDKYVIYDHAYEADVRHWQVTRDAIKANFLQEGEEYPEVIKHPKEDKAALMIPKKGAIYVQDVPVGGLDFSIFFTAQETARPLTELPEDWGLRN